MNLFTGCTYYEMLVHQSPDAYDMKIFSNRSISHSNHPYHFNYSNKYLTYLDTVKLYNPYTKQESTLDTLLSYDKTSAFIIYINNQIVCEKYFRGRTESQVSCVFSISKSILSALTGIAISNGQIQSIDQKITDFIPQLKENPNFNQITIKHLLQMSSGLEWRKNKAFDDDGKFYYTSDIRRLIVRHKLKKVPGSGWEYKNIDSELLGWVLENATESTISDLVNKYLWEPMGSEFDAFWSLDSRNGVEKASSSFNACARDLLKFGCIYLNNGNFNNKQIVPKGWIANIFDIPPSPDQQPSLKHNLLWWIPNDGIEREIVADGYLGQRLTINPKYNIVIVKLSEANSNTDLDKVLRYIINSEASLSAQKTSANKIVAGSWLGKLSSGGMELRVVFNLKIEKDSLKCTLDSPDQGATGIPCGKVTLDKQKLIILAPGINGEYTGTVTTDSTINGTWNQNGGTYPLNLKKKITK